MCYHQIYSRDLFRLFLLDNKEESYNRAINEMNISNALKSIKISIHIYKYNPNVTGKQLLNNIPDLIYKTIVSNSAKTDNVSFMPPRASITFQSNLYNKVASTKTPNQPEGLRDYVEVANFLRIQSPYKIR